MYLARIYWEDGRTIATVLTATRERAVEIAERTAAEAAEYEADLVREVGKRPASAERYRRMMRIRIWAREPGDVRTEVYRNPDAIRQILAGDATAYAIRWYEW